MRSVLIFLCAALVAAQENITSQVNTTVPTISPTYEPTTTFPPTGTPTRAPVPAPVPVRPCYSNLTEIEDLVKLKNPFLLETYILCPNTTYQMGTFDVTTFRIENGSQPIYTRSNSIYQCGEDGKSSNNCIITGGEYHVFHEYVSYGRENKVNVVMKGLTFEDASGGGLIIAAPGDITFIDCVFRNHENTGVIPLLFSYVTSRRLRAITNMQADGDNMGRVMKYYHDILHDAVEFQKFKDGAARSHQRHLQGGEILELQNVTFDGCVFENNRHGPDSVLTIDGMIYVASSSNELNIKNTIFRNNTFTTPINGGNGFAVSAVADAKVTISNTCFTDNEFIGSGVVVMEGTLDYFFSSDVTGTIDPTLECSYASIGFESCFEYDRDSCSASDPEIPIDTNIVSPTAGPVSVTVLAGPVAAAAPTNSGKTSSGFSIHTGLSLVAFLMSVIVVL